jgi:hypothetical protein
MLARIINWNTGVKGEATAIHFPDVRRLQFVDFGCWPCDRIYVCNTICNDLPKLCNGLNLNTLDIILTHLHADHYNLTSLTTYCCLLNGSSINTINIYIPGVPHEPPEVRNIALGLLVLHEIVLKLVAEGVGATLDSIIKLFNIYCKKTLNITLLYRGDVVDIGGGTKIRVVWPPKKFPQKLRKRELRKLRKRYSEVLEALKKVCSSGSNESACKGIDELEEIVKMLGDELEKYQERKGHITISPDSNLAKYLLLFPFTTYSYLPPLDVYYYYYRFFEYLRSKRELMMALLRISNALNDFSLILEYHHYYGNKRSKVLIVIPGDNSDDVLNYVGDLEGKPVGGSARDVVFLRGAHHGTRYGKYLSLFKPGVTWLSEYKPEHSQYRLEYWSNTCTNPRLVITARNAAKTEIEIDNPSAWRVHVYK